MKKKDDYDKDRRRKDNYDDDDAERVSENNFAIMHKKLWLNVKIAIKHSDSSDSLQLTAPSPPFR